MKLWEAILQYLGCFFSCPGPAGARLWLIPCSSTGCLFTYPKPSPAPKEGPVSHGAAACHVCFPCQNPELHPTPGEKGKGEQSSVETHQSLSRTKPLEISCSAWVPRPT